VTVTSTDVEKAGDTFRSAANGLFWKYVFACVQPGMARVRHARGAAGLREHAAIALRSDDRPRLMPDQSPGGRRFWSGKACNVEECCVAPWRALRDRLADAIDAVSALVERISGPADTASLDRLSVALRHGEDDPAASVFGECLEAVTVALHKLERRCAAQEPRRPSKQRRQSVAKRERLEKLRAMMRSPGWDSRGMDHVAYKLGVEGRTLRDYLKELRQ